MTPKQPDFYPLSVASEKCRIMPENILSDWLDHKIPLYIRLDALPCRIVRYLGGGQFLLEDWQRKIKTGMDYYQHEKMPEFKIRQFYPEKDAEIEARLLEGDLGLCRYTYNGHAHGYWRVKATPVTRFAEDHYVLTDIDTVRENNNIPGAVSVYGKNESDYLIFPDEVHRDKSELFFDANDIPFQNGEIMPEEKKEKQTRISRPERRALYVMLKEHYLDSNNEVNYSKMAEMLTVDARKYGFSDHFSDDTIAEWIKRFDDKK
ncbi:MULTISPECIES: hypothetical protein [Enterobacterales]|uniref:hypothetical protein n=1 Tax=Enterobacterales TaxID=91347 RepID=UPI002063E121|nr:hypothetical protein [Dickeya zeae]UPT57375.1 hypothetical protein FGI00_18345 [Dickeya zeae]